MAASGPARCALADGTAVTVEGDDLRHVYRELWALTDLPGAVSTAALLVHEAERHPHYRQPISLDGPQTVAFRRALDQSASSS